MPLLATSACLLRRDALPDGALRTLGLLLAARDAGRAPTVRAIARELG